MAPKERQVSSRELCACCYCTKCHLGDERSGQGGQGGDRGGPRRDRGGPRGTGGDRGGPRGGGEGDRGGPTRTDGDRRRPRQDKTGQDSPERQQNLHAHALTYKTGNTLPHARSMLRTHSCRPWHLFGHHMGKRPEATKRRNKSVVFRLCTRQA